MQGSVRQKMFKKISRWQQSGLTQKAWCVKNKMPYATFQYWYKRYRATKAPGEGQDTHDAFVQLKVQANDCWCELILANGKKLVFRQPVSAEFLNILVA